MRITGINSQINGKYTSFGRRPRNEEEADLQKTMNEGFEAAGVKQRVAITHGSVFPAVGRDSFIGSPYGEGAKEWIKFLRLYGFNGNQLGPGGMILYDDRNYSPYNASALNENPLFIDLKLLTTEEYGKILSEESYEKLTIPAEANDRDYRFTDFSEAKFVSHQALTESYKNFKANLAKGQPLAIKLNKEFEEYLTEKGKQTEEEGIYRVLSTMYGDEDCDKWSKHDSDLMVNIRQNDPNAIKHYASLKKRFKNPIEQYQFEQFLTTKQIKENKEFRDNAGMKYYSDLLVGCSKMDYWRYKEAFLKGYYMGAPEWDPARDHQTWGVNVLNPRKLFIGDSELNIGGQFLKEKIRHALEYCENTRIDHAMGLIEPFVYRGDSVEYDDNGRQIKDKLYGRFMSKLFDEYGKPMDTHYDYPRILEKIVFPTLKEKDLNQNDPVWEHICCEPALFKQIYYDRHHLPQLIMFDDRRAKNFINNNNNWYLLGSHDSIPLLNSLRDRSEGLRRNENWDPMYLAGYLNQDPQRAGESSKFCEKISDRNPDGTFKTGIEAEKADKAIVDAKFAELMTKEKIQISFADILGLTETGLSYNIGGSSNKINWRERIAPDFLDKYYENLSSDNPTALNMPEILKTAVQASIDGKLVAYMDAVKNDSDKDQKIMQKRTELYDKYGYLLDKLQYYADILKEKE